MWEKSWCWNYRIESPLGWGSVKARGVSEKPPGGANRCYRDCLKYRLKDSELQRPSALMSSSPKPLSDACWAALRRKLWPEYLGAVWPYKLAALFRRVVIIQSRVMRVSSKPNRGLSQCNGCTLKRPCNTCTGHVEVPVAAKTISTPRWAVSDLLLGGRLIGSGVIYWSQCVEGSICVYVVYIGC